METNIIYELIGIGVILIIGFLAIKLGITQDEVVNANKKIKTLEESKEVLLQAYADAYVSYLEASKELKAIKNTNPTPRHKKKQKDLNQALNEMNKHK